MDETPNLRLPYIMAAQAQKHVTHNEAIRALDAILQLAVRDRDLANPPASPADGDRYIVADPAGGPWAGHEGKVAAFQDGAWMFYAPREGWIAWIADEDAAVAWDGSAWIAFVSGGANASPAMLGINATADASNRLAVASPASLFNHEGAGHQLKLNKAGAADTASLLYQSNFSGRAELGLTGDDDFHFKVSTDGANWKEAIVIARSTGAVSFPNTTLGGSGPPGRLFLTASRTYYVNGASGANTNDGLSAGTAFATIQKAVDTVADLDLGVHNATISIAAGTYVEAITLKPLTGAGRCVIAGDETTPANVKVHAPAGSDAFFGPSLFSTYHLRGMEITATGSGSNGESAIHLNGNGSVLIRNLKFGVCEMAHIRLGGGAYLDTDGDYEIAGGAAYHIAAISGTAMVRLSTVTLTGTPAFNKVGVSAFVWADRLALVQISNVTFAGGAVGKRHNVTFNSVLYTGGLALPGNAAGTTSTGGQYI